MNITGGCHCGELAYTAKIDPEKVYICHCSDCQTLSASAFRTVVKSAPAGLTFTKGQAKEYIKTAESGNQRAQGFCQNCGTAIYATSVGDEARIYNIRVGSIEQRDELVPSVQTWCRSAQSWLHNIENLPAFDAGLQS